MLAIEINKLNLTSTAHHILIIEDQKSRQTIYLENDTYTVGRHSSNSIVALSTSLSRFHATLLKRKDLDQNQDCYWILDGDLSNNKSNNGLFINQKRRLVHQLKNGDVINFGPEVKGSYHVIPRSNIIEGDSVSNSISNTSNQEGIRSTLIDENISEGRYENEKLKKEQILYDPATNLANKTLFNEHLSKALAQAKRNPTQLAVITLEIDRFENIKNSLGESIENKLLQSIAERLESCLRTGDVISHAQEAQFTILIPRINNVDHVIKLSQRILDNLKPAIDMEEHQLQINSNMGIAIYPQDGQDQDTLLKRSQVALYRVKQKGHNNYGFYNQEMNTRIAGIMKLEKLLHQALNRNEFSLYYQPLVNIRKGTIYGLEALLRWQHPTIGLIFPYQFISLVENSNMMILLSKWVLKTACKQLKQWCDEGLSPLPVAVNISSQEFYHTDFPKLVGETLQETRLSSHLLELDITEKTLLENTARSQKILQELKRLGVRISIDDFGIGGASLTDLKKLPVNNLKIAQSLIGQLKTNPQDTSLVAAALAWGKSFKMRVIAEGVETQQQLDVLRNLHYEEMQGYRFSHPLKTDQVATYLSKHTVNS